MKKKIEILLLALFAIGVGQVHAQQVKATDSLVTINPSVSNFNELKIGGPVDIVITQGSTESLKLTVPAEVKDRVVAEVSGHVLRIHNKHDNWGQSEKSWYSDKSYWHRTHARIVAYVTVKELRKITLSGSGTMAFDNGLTTDEMKLTLRGSGDMHGKITTKYLATKVSGSGKITISGSAEHSKVSVTGSGNFIAADLVTSNSIVKISGSGDAKVNASEEIYAGVSGSGGVSYTGGAKKVTSTKSGSGYVNRF
jgi:hypothetical protein